MSNNLTYEDGLLDAQRMANEKAAAAREAGKLREAMALEDLSTDLLIARVGEFKK